jgi:NADH dehydrogenase/NADH:ubiquinone oxidoreductase subunit G
MPGVHVMQIVQQGDWLKVARITSLNDHYLGLRFGAEPLSDQRPVAADVMKAVSLANADFGTDYQVSEIQIDERDTYRPQIYQMPAYQLVQYAVGQGLVFGD